MNFHLRKTVKSAIGNSTKRTEITETKDISEYLYNNKTLQKYCRPLGHLEYLENQIDTNRKIEHLTKCKK